jgi:hypothetical protein
MKQVSTGRAGVFASVLSVFVLTLIFPALAGASVWEGAAALAPRGELPEEGYYVATNSFPPNTVVDITNLETGRSIRATVASGLNTLGLLAVLSPDAASRIGLGTKTIGRIRMTQPEDPIAFARFTEGQVASGDPDYDPAAMLAVSTYADAQARAASGQADGGPTADAGARKLPERAASSEGAPEAPPSSVYNPPGSLEYTEYNDYAPNSIVSIGRASAAPQTPPAYLADDWDKDWDEMSHSAYFSEGEDSPEQSNYPIWEQGGSVGKPESQGTAEEPLDPWEEVWRETGSSQGRLVMEAQSSARSSGEESSAGTQLLIQQPIQNAPPGTGEVLEYSLIPAEERPPSPGPEPPAPLPESPQAAALIDESLFIDSIEKLREDRARAADAARLAEERRATEEAARLAEERRLAENAARLAEERRAADADLPQVTLVLPRVAAIESAPPAREISPEPPLEIQLITGSSPSTAPLPERSTAPSFSVPVNIITEMEKGKYYVQLGVFRNVASVESALLGIDSGYPLNVQNTGDAGKPLYRLLVGPVNLGESGALVRHFKDFGYQDAYIRHGG